MASNQVLVTGGAGYLGSILTKQLVKKNRKVIVLDAFFFGTKPLNHLSKKITLLNKDIRNIPQKVLKNIHTVFHLAAFSNDPTAEFNPQANHEINTHATIQLATKAKAAGVKRFVFASSCSIYDSDDHHGSIKDENHKVHPLRNYSISKYAAEKSLLKIAGNNFCVTILRIGTIFGISPRMRYDLIVNSMVKDALSQGTIEVYSGGNQWRPLIDVGDSALAFIFASTAPQAKVNHQIINISFNNFRVSNVATRIQKTLKKNFSINPKIIYNKSNTPSRSYKVSTQKAKRILDFTPKTSIEQSVVQMVKKIKKEELNDFSNPKYYNIEWMKPILESQSQNK